MRIPGLVLASLIGAASIAHSAEEKDFKFFSFGPGVLFNQDSDGLAYHLAGGYFHQAMSKAGIRAMGTVDFNDNSLNAGGALGALAFFPTGEFAPYGGADLGWGVAYGDGWSNGFILGSSVGLQMFRSSSVQLTIEGRSTVLLATNDGGYPVSLSGSLGMSF